MLNARFFMLILVFFVASFHSLAWADVTVSPMGVAIALPDGEEVEDHLTLTNHGDEEVLFWINDNSRNWDGDGNDEERRGPERDPRGGPDDLTYEWRDSAEEDGPEFDWIDITEFEDAVLVRDVGDDTFHGMFDLGFEFGYYGNVYESVGLHSNGWASFVEAFEIAFHYPAWGPLPNDQPGGVEQTPPPTLLAVMYQDLDPLRDGEIYYWTNGQTMAIITWQDVQHFFDADIENGEPWTFQVIIYANGFIKYQYLQIGDEDQDRLSVLIGLQNEDQDMGFTVINDEFDYLEPELAIGFGPENNWVPWLNYDPPSGIIPANESVEVELIIDPDELDAETVNLANMIIGFNNPEIPCVLVPIIVSVELPVGTVAGTVTDAASGAPIESVYLKIEPSGLTRFTDADGNYRMPNMPTGMYSLMGSFGDYFDALAEDLEVEAGGEADGSMAFLHAECNFDRENIITEVAPGQETHLDFNISNDGNAPLTYTTSRQLPGGANVDPWSLRESYFIGALFEDTRINGVVFLDDHFYISGDHSNDPAIYVLDREENLVRIIEQPTEERRGMKDLATDGTLIYGVIGEMILGMTTAGEVEFTIESPINPTSCITYDPINNWLWISGTTTDFMAIDMEGNPITEIGRQDLRIYGLAFWPDDPEGKQLYVFHKDRDNDMQAINKFDTENGEMEFITYLQPEVDGSPVGAFISNQYDVYSWVFMGITNSVENDGGDHLDIWQLDARRDWFVIDPSEGVIDAGANQEYDLLLDASDLPPARFEGTITFEHDGFGRRTVLPVVLNVVEGPVHDQRTLQLGIGWNLVSLNLAPDDDDVIVITQELVDNNLLIMMKDGIGQFYNPEFNFNNIPGWDVTQGYQIKMAEAAELIVEGITVMADDPLQLGEGWNMISYFPRDPINAIVALSGIVDQLLIAKDALGNFYSPEFGFSNMGNMREGQGYQVKTASDVELVYRFVIEEEAAFAGHDDKAYSQRILPVLAPTGSNMSLLVLSDGSLQGEVGVFAGDVLVGSGTLNGGQSGIAVWEDDPTTSIVDGALPSQNLEIKLFNSDGALETTTYKSVSGIPVYSTDGFWAAELEHDADLPVHFGIANAYPNPFNSRTSIEYSLIESGRFSLSLFDLAGRQVRQLQSGVHPAGSYLYTFDGMDLSSGIYMIQLKMNNRVSSKKLIFMK